LFLSMKIIFFGTPSYAVPSLEQLLQHPNFQVLGVVTQPDKRRGRGGQLSPSPVKTVALAHQLPIWQPQRIKKDIDTLQALQASQADAFVVIAYGQILSPEILDMPRLGCINAHGSILPDYRGAAPMQWCLYNGEQKTGVTTMLMDAGMDTGPMLLKAYTSVGLLENVQSLAEKLAQMSADLLVETLLKLQKREIQPTPQDDTQATYARLIQKEDYLIDWSRSAFNLHNQIRGFFPNCLATFREQTLKVLATVPLSEAYESQLPAELQILLQHCQTIGTHETKSPGSILSIAKGLGPIIQTGEGGLLLQELQPAGKRSQSGWDFANGNRIAIGEQLENGSLA
jgi:methionyl-tRNA formyltransferase